MSIVFFMLTFPFIGICVPIALVTGLVCYFLSKEPGDKYAKVARICFITFLGLIALLVFGASFFFVSATSVMY